MKTLTFTLFLALICGFGFAQYQDKSNEYLKHQLSITQSDTNSVKVLSQLCFNYSDVNPDSAKLFGEKALVLARKVNFKKGKAIALTYLGRYYGSQGEASKALKLHFDALQINEAYQFKTQTALSLNFIGVMYNSLQQNSIAKYYFLKSEETAKGLTLFWQLSLDLNIGEVYRSLNQLDSAQIYLKKAGDEFKSSSIKDSEEVRYLNLLGQTQYDLGNHQKGLDTLRKSYLLSSSPLMMAHTGNIIAKFYKEMNQPDSAISYAKKSLNSANKQNNNIGKLKSAELLAELYEAKDPKQALYYQKIAKTANDELYGIKKIQELQQIISDEQQRQREIESQKIIYQNQLTQYLLLAGLGVMFLIGFILYRNNRQKQKANAILQGKNEEIQSTLSKLKSTQAQLIQAEKLASLGELTAGIAHEIQNPLNFVNNFSELSVELLQELSDEIKAPIGGLGAELLADISQNLEKINHHGKRASSIVKGMLEHSRASTGVKELTDINALADEYLRLAYHGLRAKDSNFNATLETHFDENLPKIEVIPQDIGRVLLNIINNAFYAVSVGRTSSSSAKVIISTKRLDNFIEIRITDNGIGMNEATKAKIFQPFFTTKPTGQGTGLGLSLAYDIVTKGHDGTIEVSSIEGQGTTFIVALPA
jgi:two-component system, NtrC family, sensor kinase